MRTRHDREYKPGDEWASITCPRCNCRVVYSLKAETRPKYCPDCEDAEYYKFMKSEYWKNLDLDTRHDRVMQELRMLMPLVQNRTVQEMVQ